MATQSREDLKSYFEDGDTPTEAQFEHLIDSMLNLADTGTQHVQGFISASGVNAGAYSLESLDFQTVTTELTILSFTGSNTFGSQSSAQDQLADLTGVSSQSMFGPIFQSSSGAGSASHFMSTALFGTTTSSQANADASYVGRGVSIFKDHNIGNTLIDIAQESQIKSSSLAIFNSNTNHLIFDESKIVQRGNDELEIRADGVSGSHGKIKLVANITGSTQVGSTQGFLIVSSSGNVGIGTTSPIFTLDINQPSASARIKNSEASSSLNGDVHLSLESSQSSISYITFGDGDDAHSGSIKYNNNINTFIFSTSGSERVRITDTGNISASANISASGTISSTLLSSSGHIQISASTPDGLTNGSGFRAVVMDTGSGRLYFTGSYGGGGGGGDTVGDLDWHINASYLTSSVKVGVKRVPSLYDFEVQGTMAATADVIAYMSSDKRLKDNIKPIENPIDKIKQIGGYTFDWNDKQDIYKGSDFGVIAQEIEKVLPSLVQDREDGYKGVKYDKIVSLLIEAIKDQQKQIDELKKLI